MMRILFKSILLAMILASFLLLVGAQRQTPPPLASGEKASLAQEIAAVHADPPLRKGVLLLFPYQAELPHHKLTAQKLNVYQLPRTLLGLARRWIILNPIPDSI